MKTLQFIKATERLIAEHQEVQRVSPPSSDRWEKASEEINRLAALIVEATRTGATITVWWGNDDVKATIHLTPRNWAKVKSGKPLQVRGKGYWYEGERFQDYWHFGGGIDGELLVEYGDDAAVGFIGKLGDAKIEEA